MDKISKDKKYVTRDGQPVTITKVYDWDTKYPVWGSYGAEHIRCCWEADGGWLGGTLGPLDLIEVVEEVTDSNYKETCND